MAKFFNLLSLLSFFLFFLKIQDSLDWLPKNLIISRCIKYIQADNNLAYFNLKKSVGGKIVREKIILIEIDLKERNGGGNRVKTKTRGRMVQIRSSIQRPWCHVKLHTPFQHPRHCTIVWGTRSTQSVPCNRTDILMHTT